MNKVLINKYFLYSLRTIISIIFVYSVYAKLQDFRNVVLFVSNLTGLDLETARYIAVALISLEFFIAIEILISSNFLTYTVAAFFMMIMIFATLYMMTQKIENCMCFGNLLKLSPIESLLKNLLIILLLMPLLINTLKLKIIRIDLFYSILTFVSILIFSLYFFNSSKNYFSDLNITSIKKNEIITNGIENYLLIDARLDELYQLQHIESAINIHYNGTSISEDVIKQINETNKIIVVYCDDNNCGLAYNFGLALKEYFNEDSKTIYYLEGGISEWNK